MSEQYYTPVTDAEDLFGDGDWRQVLAEGPRNAGWKLHSIGKNSIEKNAAGVLLPAFDFGLSLNDQAFFSKYLPLWSNNADKRSPRHFSPNAFAHPMLMYPFLGESKEHWMSPKNLLKMVGGNTMDPEDARDAFDDLNKWVRRNKTYSDAKRGALLKTDKLSEDPVIPGYSARYFSLAQMTEDDEEDYLALVCFTQSAFGYIIDQARWMTPRSEASGRDPNFPDYLLGDVTDPRSALPWHVAKVALDPKEPKRQTNCLCFTREREVLDPNNRAIQVSQETLDKRFLMQDPANWNIPTYEEQVDYIVSSYGAEVSIEMIQAACGDRYRGDGGMPSQRPESITLQSQRNAAHEDESQQRTQRAPAGDPMDAVTGGDQPQSAGSMAPKSSAPPQPQSEPDPLPDSAPGDPQAAAAPAEPEEEYWAGRPKGDPAVKMTPSALQELVDSGKYEGIRVYIGTEWLDVLVCGLVTPPAPPQQEEPPAPEIPVADAPPEVQDGAPPTVESAPHQETAPAQEAAPTAAPAGAPAPEGGGVTKEKFIGDLFSDSPIDKMEVDKQAEAYAVADAAWDESKGGTNMNFSSDIVNRLMALMP